MAILATVLGLYARTFLILPIHIPSESMVDALLPGDRVLVDRWIYGSTGEGSGKSGRFPGRDPRRGDVLAIAAPEPDTRMLVKRCIGLPGETIEIDVHGQIRIDGRLLSELGDWGDLGKVEGGPVRARGSDPGPDGALPLHIRLDAGQFFVLGDHRRRSRDSRHWGAIDRRRVLGRIFLIYWSTEPPASPTAENSDGWGNMIWLSSLGIQNIRWERAFQPVR